MKMHMFRFNQRGDTIVEVLICMAIISLVLGGAFVTTRNSQLGVRDSQEHAEALKLVESQLEQLRADAADAKAAASPFCMYNAATATIASGNCTQDSAGLPRQADSRYKLSIARAAPDANGGYLFTVTATWPDVNGNGNAQESMVYRLY